MELKSWIIGGIKFSEGLKVCRAVQLKKNRRAGPTNLNDNLCAKVIFIILQNRCSGDRCWRTIT